MTDLYQHSIDVIHEGQAPTGAYIACPNMDDYAYSWFRDGTYIAYAMDLAGEHASARAFHDWAAGVVLARRAVVERALAKTAWGEPLAPDDYLHTRYTLDGEESNAEWPNFQLDGFGTWLWGMAEHVRLAGLDAPPGTWRDAGELVARYLAGLWREPNFDCWEEFPDKVHLYTLAALYGGLRAFAGGSGLAQVADTASEIRAFVLDQGVVNGHFVKFLGTDMVDASLLGLAVPYGVIPTDDPRMQRTVARIEADLRRDGGGVHRYVEDTYYGGGEWLLLTDWLGWLYAVDGQAPRAAELHQWVAAQAGDGGDLPEQVPHHLNAPDYLDPWIEQRGPIATPLLWSHAMYCILENALGGV
jgi:GH15 family glucan-1,4-alpha-glucosidase